MMALINAYEALRECLAPSNIVSMISLSYSERLTFHWPNNHTQAN